MRRPIPLPGSTIWIRRRRWRVERALFDHGIVRLDVADREERLTFLSPYDRPIRAPRQPRPIRAARPEAQARVARALGHTVRATSPQSARDAHITIWPHQLEPVLAVLAGHRRVLIADEVGLGKTIQAALVIAELHRRLPACRILLIVPASLREQWADELATRFRLTSRPAERETLCRSDEDEQSANNPWRQAGTWITSVDYLKQPYVLDAMPTIPWDLVVIDEAHTATGRSDRHDACDEIGRRARHLLLLTATPHSGDEARFNRLLRLGSLGNADDRLVVFRRTRENTSISLARHVRWRPLSLPQASARLLDALLAFERVVLKRSAAIQRDAALLLLAVYRRRALSTPHALDRTLERRLEWLEAPERAYRLEWLQPRLDFGADDDDLAEEERTMLIADLGVPALEERVWIRRLRTLAREADRADPKIRRLVALAARTDEAMVVFTEYRHSLERVARSISSVRVVATLHGGLSATEQRAQLRRFLDGEATVLVTTDVGGQGLNLQSAARWVVNLELPWNPTRLEQRIGRVDRLGQTRPVHATMLILNHQTEATLLATLARRTLTAQKQVGAGHLSVVVPPTTLTLASILVGGRPATDLAFTTSPLVVATAWQRQARASAAWIRTTRTWRMRWRGPLESGGRPRVSRWPIRLGPNTRASTAFGYAASIVDEAGSLVERHVVVLIVPGHLAAHDPALSPELEEAARRTLGARVRRLQRHLCAAATRRMESERAIAMHLHTLRRPELTQLGLFSRRAGRTADQAVAADALADEATQVRIRFEEQSTNVLVAPPELLWIWQG